MRYIYKTVSLAEFLKNNKDARIGFVSTPRSQEGWENQASMAVGRLINFYARQGWEYVRSEEFFADFFKSGTAHFFDGLYGDNKNPRLHMFIFKKECTEDEQKKFEEDENRGLEEISKGEDNSDFKSYI